MSVQIQLRRGTAAEWTSANPTLAAGEAGFETDTGKLKLGDGSTAWTSLAYFGGLADMGVITYLDGTVAAAPGTPASGKLRIYAKTGKVLAVKDDTGAETELGAGGGGIPDQGMFTYLDATEGAAPGTPASGYARIYAKSDGRIYSKDDGGIEYGPFDAAGGGGGAALYLPATVTPHATYGDDFQGDLSKWTNFGTHNFDPDLIAHTGYAPQVLRLRAQGAAGIYQALPAGDCRLTLIIAAVTNSAGAHMIGLGMWSSAATGGCLTSYTDGNTYKAYMTSGIYAGNWGIVGVSPLGVSGWSTTTCWSWVLQIEYDESENKIRGRQSWDGGLHFWAWSTWSDALPATPTRMGIIKCYPAGSQADVYEIYWFNYEAI